MGVAHFGDVHVVGNFAERTEQPPVDFDYMSDAKWYELYPPELDGCREQIGKTICDCTRIKVDYMPYYGWDRSHSDECALLQRVKERPQLANLMAFSYLPALYPHSNPNCKHPVMKEEE